MKKIIVSMVLSAGLLHSAWAGCCADPHGWYAGIGTGFVFSKHSHQHNYVTTDHEWPKDLYHFSTSNDAGLAMVQGGYTWASQCVWFPYYSLGANYTYVFPAELKGSISQFSLPAFTNYHFRYKVQRQTGLITAKADIYRFCQLMPFLLAGAGMSFNRTRQYAEYPIGDITPRQSPGFSGKSNRAFSFVFGAGFDLIASRRLLLTLEYQYGNYGHANSGHGNNVYMTERLTTRLTSNTIQLSANYYFDKCL